MPAQGTKVGVTVKPVSGSVPERLAGQGTRAVTVNVSALAVAAQAASRLTASTSRHARPPPARACAGADPPRRIAGSHPARPAAWRAFDGSGIAPLLPFDVADGLAAGGQGCRKAALAVAA
jgi:hypothetical protein